MSYRHKHNEANGEANNDGHNANYSVNCGVEGPTEDAAINAERARLARALLATVLLAQGTPMLAAGDELGHSQRGNNNAYCQDNPIGWIDWQHADAALAAFVARLTELRRRLPALRQSRWLSDHLRADGGREVDWRDPAGHEMTVARWHDTDRHCLTVTIAPEDADAVLLIFNAEPRAHDCVLPAGRWCCVLDSSDPDAAERTLQGEWVEAPPQSVLVLHAIA